MKKECVFFLSLFYSFYAFSVLEPECLLTRNINVAESIHEEANIQEEGFIAGTQIKTPEGYKSIEDIKAGDLITGFDPIEGYQEKSVLGVTTNQIKKYIKISVGNEIVYTGFNQQFYLPEKNDWVIALHISPSSVNYAEIISRPVDIYCIEVEDHSFCITPRDIVVHNSFIIGPSTALILNIGRMILRYPIEIASVASCLEKAYLNRDKLEVEKEENKINKPIKINDTPERTNYEKHRSELFELRNDFLRIKDELNQLIECQSFREINFTKALFNAIKSADVSSLNLILLPTQESQYNDEQKTNLRKLRQSELDQIKQQILELQIALAFHFNELIDARNRAIADDNSLILVVNQSVNLWNANLENITDNTAMSNYESILTSEDSLKNIENRNQELQVAIKYYKNIKNGCILKRTTNISDLIAQEEKKILATEQLISQSRNRNSINQKIVETFLIRRNIHIVGLATNLNSKIKKQRESKLAKEFAEAEKIRVSIKFPQDPQKDNNEDFFERLKKRTDKVARSNRFGKIYRDPDTKLWWSKDNAGHGGSKYKVFKEGSRGFEWQFDADAIGKEIVGKHKGPTGIFIPYKEVVF